jgi:hypothetical protein
MTGSWGERHARLSQECRRQRLERRYRRLLALYPRQHRRDHADEMVGVLLASAFDSGELGATRLGHLADVVDLVAGAFRIRARNAVKRARRPGWLRGAVRDERWSDALAMVSVVAPLLLLVAMLAQFNIPQAAASTVTGQPYWPLTGAYYVPDWPLTVGAPFVVALAFCRLRRLAGLAALATAFSQLFLLPAQSIASYASPALAFSVLLALTAAAGLMLSPGPARAFTLLRWWGVATIGVVALILGGFSMGGFSLSGFLVNIGPYAPDSYTNLTVLQPTEIAGLGSDFVIAGVLVLVSFGCLFTPAGRRALALFAIPIIPYAYIWADKLAADVASSLDGFSEIQSSVLLLYLPPAVVACLIVTGTKFARRRAGSARRVASQRA